MSALPFTAKTGCRHAAVWERELCSNLKPQRRLRSNRLRCWDAPCGARHRYRLALVLARVIPEVFLDPVARHADKAPLPGAGCMPADIERVGRLWGHADRPPVRTARCRQRGEQKRASRRTAQNRTWQMLQGRRVRACRRRSFMPRFCLSQKDRRQARSRAVQLLTIPCVAYARKC
jgi:hypothetical protein